jgi:transposase
MRNTLREQETIARKYQALSDCLTEKGKRLWAAAESLSYGHGGIRLVGQATHLARSTIHRGIKEIQREHVPKIKGIRKQGGGRKKISTKQETLIASLDALVEPTSRGDPESPLRWICKSTRNLANELKKQGYKIGYRTTANLLHELEYSLQSNKKTLEGSSHVDRNAQFCYINESIIKLQRDGQPTISVDTKKKENIGNYKNNGQELCKKGSPVEVKGHDFIDKRLGKVVPYGVYDIGKNTGWVSVGISADTAEFAVNSIRTWWYTMGIQSYSKAKELLITADCGGSNGHRVRLWKYELQRLSDETGLSIHVRHFPPGTSKWNKIEHRLFSYISQNWRGRPLLTREIVVNLISNTRTNTGLAVKAVLDENEYKLGREISDEELISMNVLGDEFHPEWNYTIKSRFPLQM